MSEERLRKGRGKRSQRSRKGRGKGEAGQFGTTHLPEEGPADPAPQNSKSAHPLIQNTKAGITQRRFGGAHREAAPSSELEPSAECEALSGYMPPTPMPSRSRQAQNT